MPQLRPARTEVFATNTHEDNGVTIIVNAPHPLRTGDLDRPER
jgi:hypothetical protein